MKYVIVEVNKYFFIKRMSDSGQRHWDILCDTPFDSLDKAKAYLKFYKEIYLDGTNYDGSFKVCYSE